MIFGLITVVGAVAAYLLVQDFPDKNTFLSPEQTAWVLARIDADRSDAQYDHWTMKKFWGYMVDPHLWSFAVLFGAVCTTTYVSIHVSFTPYLISDRLVCRPSLTSSPSFLYKEWVTPPSMPNSSLHHHTSSLPSSPSPWPSSVTRQGTADRSSSSNPSSLSSVYA